MILKQNMSDIVDLKSKLQPDDNNPKSRNFEIHNITGQTTRSESSSELFHKSPEKKEISLPKDPSAPARSIEVNFAMFSELVGNSSSRRVIEENSQETIIINPDLLTKLASAKEEKDNNKLSIIFCIGLIIGIAFAWIIINEF